MSKQKIVSIEIELKDYEPIKFTMKEAKELYEQLHELFGDKEQHNHYHSYPWYNRPYYTWANTTTGPNLRGTSAEKLPEPTRITCANDLVGKAVTSNNTGMKVSFIGPS